MPFLFAVPEGATVEAIWRCKRGHESPAELTLIDGTSVRAFEIQITTATGEDIAVCLRCLAEDYRTERVTFGDG